MSLLTERWSDKISDVLSCYDRILIHGTLPAVNTVLAVCGQISRNEGFQVHG